MMDDLDLRYLGTAEKARITSYFVAQLKYYQDQKPWQYDLRNALWDFVVRTNKNFSGAQLREAASSACEQIGGILARMSINNAEMITEEVEDFTSYHMSVIEEANEIGLVGLPAYEPNWRVTTPIEILNVYDNTTYVGVVHARDFIKHWYGEIDVHGYVPTFAVHRKLYYDWVGNARVGRTVAKALRTEKEPWKLLLKKMVEHDAVDCLKIREVLPNTVPDQQLLEFGRIYRVK